MKNLIRWVSSSVAVPFLITACVQLLQKTLERFEFYDSPVKAIGELMNWLEHLIGVEAYPWVAGLSIGLAAGLWLDSVLGMFDKRYPFTKHDKALSIAGEVERVAAKIKFSLENSSFADLDYETSVAEASALIGRLVKTAGFPKFKRPSDPHKILHHMYRYLSWISPCLIAGDVKRAYLAAEVANSINDQPVSL